MYYFLETLLKDTLLLDRIVLKTSWHILKVTKNIFNKEHNIFNVLLIMAIIWSSYSFYKWYSFISCPMKEICTLGGILDLFILFALYLNFAYSPIKMKFYYIKYHKWFSKFFLFWIKFTCEIITIIIWFIFGFINI